MLTKLLADSLGILDSENITFFGIFKTAIFYIIFCIFVIIGGNSKTLLIVNICPDVSNLSETLSSLNFASRARNSVLSLGNRDTIKKWKDTVSL